MHLLHGRVLALLLHLAQLEVVEVVGQHHEGVGHLLGRPVGLENLRHLVVPDYGENDLSYWGGTMGMELPTVSEQH